MNRYLRCQKQRKKRYGTNDRRGRIPNPTMIDKRPAIVQTRSRIGGWEGDTIVGKGHRGVLVSLVERKSRYPVLSHSTTKGQEPAADEMIACMAPCRQRCKTITYDNGREFGNHERMTRTLASNIYFAHPCACWERGTNEDTNGSVTQLFPTSPSLFNVSTQTLQSTVERLHHRPTKCLNWKTPHEVFFGLNTILTVALTS